MKYGRNLDAETSKLAKAQTKDETAFVLNWYSFCM